MKFKVDWSSHIGQSHVADCSSCQDYCLGWPLPDVIGLPHPEEERRIGEDDSAFIVVSDGCSTGGETDIGARIQACRLSKEVRLYSRLSAQLNPRIILEYGVNDVWRTATDQCLELLDLTARDAYATCVSCFANTSGATAHIQGDGAIAILDVQNVLTIVKGEWVNTKLVDGKSFNPTFYPVYASRLCRANGTFQNFLNAYDQTPNPLVIETTIFHEGNVKTRVEKRSLENGIEGVYIELDQNRLENTRFIALFSDGIGQVSEVTMLDAIRECLAFKNTEGSFVKRRMRGAVKKWVKDGHKLLDDLSCAVLMVASPKTESQT